MRISTSSFYEQNLLAIGRSSRSCSASSSSWRRHQVPHAGDDPVGAARSLGVSESHVADGAVRHQPQRATLALSREETALNSVTTILQNIKTLTVQAGNGTLSDADRASLATTIQSNLDQLVGVANSDDGNGQYLFAGFKSANPPFAAQAGGGVQYMGDQGQRLMQIDVARQMSTGDDGRTVFQSVQGGAGYVTRPGRQHRHGGVRRGRHQRCDAPNDGKDSPSASRAATTR